MAPQYLLVFLFPKIWEAERPAPVNQTGSLQETFCRTFCRVDVLLGGVVGRVVNQSGGRGKRKLDVSYFLTSFIFVFARHGRIDSCGRVCDRRRNGR